MARVKRVALHGSGNQQSSRRTPEQSTAQPSSNTEPEFVDLESDDQQSPSNTAAPSTIKNADMPTVSEHQAIPLEKPISENLLRGSSSLEHPTVINASIPSSSQSVVNPITTEPESISMSTTMVTEARITGASQDAGERERSSSSIPDLNMDADEVFSDLDISVEDYFIPETEVDLHGSHTPQILMLTWPQDEIRTPPHFQTPNMLEEPNWDIWDELEFNDLFVQKMQQDSSLHTDAGASTQHPAVHIPVQTPVQPTGETSENPTKRKASETVEVAAADLATEGAKPKKARKKSIVATTSKKKTVAAKPPKRKAVAKRTKVGAVGEASGSGVSKPSGPHVIPRPNKEHDGLSSSGAQQFVETQKLKGALIDKGFDSKSIKEFEFIWRVIEEQQWEEFIKVKTSYNLTLLREFYAEMSEAKTDLINLRGIAFHFTPEILNTFLHITTPTTTAFDTLTQTASKKQLDELIKVVGKPGVSWKHHPNYMLRNFNAINLLPDANVWMSFIRSSLAPTTHDSSINCERMILLYCIMTGQKVNTGDILCKAIRHSSKRNQGKFFFPGLLSNFLTAVGVPQYDTDDVHSEGDEKWAIDTKSVSRLRHEKTSHGDLLGTMHTLCAQNSALMESMIKQAAELQLIKKEVMQIQQEIRKGAEVKKGQRLKKVLAEVRKLRDKNRRLDEENKKLKEEIETGESSKMQSAAAALEAIAAEAGLNAGAFKATATQAEHQPTPME